MNTPEQTATQYKTCSVCGKADENVRRFGFIGQPKAWRHVECHAQINESIPTPPPLPLASNEGPPEAPPLAPQLPDIWRQAGSLTLSLPAGLTREQLIGIGHSLAGIARGYQWMIGDWWNYCERQYGEAESIAAEAFPGRTLATVKGWGSLAKAFEKLRRRNDSFFTVSHHREVMGLDPDLQDSLLDQAKANDWDSHELRDEVARRRREIPLGAPAQGDPLPIPPPWDWHPEGIGEPPPNIGETSAPPVPTTTIYAGGVSPPEPPPPKAAPYLSSATDNPEYNTPAQYIEMARRVLGPFNTDPASNPEAQKLIQAKYYFTKENSGLARPWFGPVWMNPPYAQIELWVDQLIDEHLENRAKTAIMLCHNATETVWYQRSLEHCGAVCLPKSRIQYTDSQPVRGSTFFYFGKDWSKFADVFSEIGPVVRVYRRMIGG